jgi:hypothetical protein
MLPGMDLNHELRRWNLFMIGFDLALGTATLLSPALTMRVLGHDRPSPETEQLFRRSGPVWLTFAASHALAAARGRPEDWWALAWLRGTEIATDAVWSRSPAISRPGARAGLWLAGAANLAMTLGYVRLARSSRQSAG